MCVGQITISLRDESGDVLQSRQVSTERVQAFFAKLTQECLRRGPYCSIGVRGMVSPTFRSHFRSHIPFDV